MDDLKKNADLGAFPWRWRWKLFLAEEGGRVSRYSYSGKTEGIWGVGYIANSEVLE